MLSHGIMRSSLKKCGSIAGKKLVSITKIIGSKSNDSRFHTL